jgi:hypothetical protein
MGAWGVGAFDNDTALDWLDTLHELGSEALLVAFQAIAEEDERIEVPQARIAVAAAEAVAASRGHPGPEMPGELAEWVDAHRGDVDEGLVAMAADAVTRIQTRSDLRDLWMDDDPREWEATITDLAERLKASGAGS